MGGNREGSEAIDGMGGGKELRGATSEIEGGGIVYKWHSHQIVSIQIILKNYLSGNQFLIYV